MGSEWVLALFATTILDVILVSYDENWCPVKVRGLNVLGSDLLRQLLPDIVPPFCVSSINTLKNTATD